MKRTNECNMEKDKRMQYGKGIILESRMNVGKGLIRHVRINGTRSIKSVVIGCKLSLIQCNFLEAENLVRKTVCWKPPRMEHSRKSILQG